MPKYAPGRHPNSLANLRPAPRWKPGQSGNPKGRPKKKRVTDYLHDLMNKAVQDGKGSETCLAEEVASAFAELFKRQLAATLDGNKKGSTKGLDLDFIKLVMDRVDPPPTRRADEGDVDATTRIIRLPFASGPTPGADPEKPFVRPPNSSEEDEASGNP